MPHPNPPAKQNLDKKGLLTISNSAYCNIHLVYGYILNHPALKRSGGGEGEGEGEGLLIYLTPAATGGGGGGYSSYTATNK